MRSPTKLIFLKYNFFEREQGGEDRNCILILDIFQGSKMEDLESVIYKIDSCARFSIQKFIHFWLSLLANRKLSASLPLLCAYPKQLKLRKSKCASMGEESTEESEEFSVAFSRGQEKHKQH